MSALHNNVDLIDLSRDELTHYAVIKSKQSQSIESEGSIIDKIDNDPRGNGNSTRIDDAWNNSNLLSYQSSRKPSSALDDDNLSMSSHASYICNTSKKKSGICNF